MWSLYHVILLIIPLIGGERAPFNFPSETSEPVAFNISVDQAIIGQAALKAKLYRPSIDLEDDSNANWLEGPPRPNMTALAEYWAEEYDWSNTEDEINARFSHYALTVRGGSGYDHPVPLHFVHERSINENATPLLILHGWPSTYLEWADVIGPLVSSASPEDQSFHVVAPDLPGFGFSPAPTHSGLNASELAVVFDNLMRELGYSKYGVISTDLGWWVGMWMADVVADSLIGHYSDFVLFQANDTDLERYAENKTTEQENLYISTIQAWFNAHSAYSTAHSQAPLLIGQVLTDSPVGFAGWIWHLIRTVSDGYEYTFDQLIERTLMLWIQGTWSGIRFYRELWTVGSRKHVDLSCS